MHMNICTPIYASTHENASTPQVRIYKIEPSVSCLNAISALKLPSKLVSRRSVFTSLSTFIFCYQNTLYFWYYAFLLRNINSIWCIIKIKYQLFIVTHSFEAPLYILQDITPMEFIWNCLWLWFQNYICNNFNLLDETLWY